MVENKRVKRHKAKTQKTDRAMVTIDVRVKSVIQQTNVVEALMGSYHTESSATSYLGSQTLTG